MYDCYLESYRADGESVYRIPLSRFPALIGRESGLAVTLNTNGVSRRHAEITEQDGHLQIRDLGSTNGTFVNHERVTGSQPLNPGDVVRFADIEFRLRVEQAAEEPAPEPDPTKTEFVALEDHVNRMPIGAQQLEQLLQERLITPLFQPIISVDDESIRGLELLGRGSHPELSELPVPLFNLAESLGRSIELSETIRDVGVRAWATSDHQHVPLFVNTEPRELRDCQRLVSSLRALHNEFPGHSLVLEIHEHAVTDQQSLSTLQESLQGMNMRLAYDDFGAGQARLLELLDTPPYAVKFDISMIRDLHTVSTERREMVGLLVKMVKKGHALALAEGVSRPEELVVCRKLGFDLVQGYLYGQPALITQLETSPPPGG